MSNAYCKFRFQNSNAVHYDVAFIVATGVGKAFKHGLTRKASHLIPSLPSTALTVDAGSLTAWKALKNEGRKVAAVYNTTQALNTILNAAS